ncbi:MAG TPA: nucleotidyltransferase domain-containing protein [Candidatus Nanoarchaeia archaeon]|nr:nucleotidyltransferase domain-containing protein [Candidatus Nanoarchaeia archaeon]
MAKKENNDEKQKQPEAVQAQASQQPGQPAVPTQEELEKKLPKDVQEKLKKIKEKLDDFQKQIVKKFDKYIMGVSLLPPPKPQQGEQPDKNRIHVLVLVDDSDSQKMSKLELKQKLTVIIQKIAEDIDKNIVPQTVILSELWQSCYDAKYDLLQLIAMGAPIYDLGMLAAIKIAEIHKTMVLKKFEKYIVSYVLAGSLVQGKATKTSDIDVFVVIDDTDVKRMTRAELKDKLRAIIIGMGIEAGEMTGIKNKINIQVYILTDFWDSIKEANPIIFTFLRDGVPFYDRGIFMPWKQLLRMGKVKPSMEAIEMYMSSGEQMLQRVGAKLKDVAVEDMFYALLTPSQAALMLYGVPPPTPKETPDLMRDIFVKKEKLLEDKFVTTLEKVIKIRKDVEHGVKKEVSGKEVDELLDASDKYLKRVKKLFAQIEKMKEEESMLNVYDTIVTVIRDILKMENIEKVKADDVVNIFEKELVHAGKIPEKFLRMLRQIEKAKKDYEAGKLTKSEVETVKKNSSQIIKFLVEYIQRKRGREIERAKIRVKHGERYGEILLLEDTAFIVHDIDHEEKELSKAVVKPDGSLGIIQKSSMEELEKHLAKYQIPPKSFIKEPIFEDLKRVFGKDVEVLINY